MRPAIVIVLGFALLISFSYFTTSHINETTDKLENQLSMTENHVIADQWNEAHDNLEDTLEEWSRVKEWWPAVLNHGTLSNIEVSLYRLEQFVKNKEKSLSLAEISTLKILLRDIPESETLRFYNIF